MTRTSEDIGRGLAPARASRPIAPGERIHVIGVAGAGASAAALLAGTAGAQVTGCDPAGSSQYTPALDAAGIAVTPAHAAGHVVGPHGPLVDRVAATKALTSIAPDHPELAAAHAAGLPLESWQQVVADAAATHGGSLVGVAGTHGKSTSTGWLVHLLAGAGRDPGAFVGALMPAALTGGIPSTARWGGGDVFVVEADEYAGNFDPYRPDVAVLLNAEWDHPDVFRDEDAVLDAFEAWLRAPGADRRTLVANVGDPGVERLYSRLGDWPGRIWLVHLGSDSDFGIANKVWHNTDGMVVGMPQEGQRLTIGGLPGEGLISGAQLGLPGRHNAANAVCVAAAAAVLGVPADAIARGLETFTGVGRRLELKGEPRGIAVYDDYGHHPTAIRASMAALRERHPGRRLWAVYEPLTYHRTAAMLDQFADVMAEADEAVVADIWAGRDPDTTITSAGALAEAIRGRGLAGATAPGSVEATADELARRVRTGDVVLVMGGGRSYVIAERLVERLSSADPE